MSKNGGWLAHDSLISARPRIKRSKAVSKCFRCSSNYVRNNKSLAWIMTGIRLRAFHSFSRSPSVVCISAENRRTNGWEMLNARGPTRTTGKSGKNVEIKSFIRSFDLQRARENAFSRKLNFAAGSAERSGRKLLIAERICCVDVTKAPPTNRTARPNRKWKRKRQLKVRSAREKKLLICITSYDVWQYVQKPISIS